MTTRKAPPHAWKPGQSGNPKGRARGSGEVARLRAAIADTVPAIVKRLTEQAMAGDTAAARLLLERTLAPLKAAETTIRLPLPESGTPEDHGRAIMGSLAAGDLAPGQAAALLSAVANLSRVIELAEIERRISALEGKP